jgi:hypothetical protein
LVAALLRLRLPMMTAMRWPQVREWSAAAQAWQLDWDLRVQRAMVL